MSHETDKIISEILARMTILRAIINGDSATFLQSIEDAEGTTEVQFKPEPLPEPEMSDEHIRILWAVSSCLGAGTLPTCAKIGELTDLSETHSQRRMKQLEDAGYLERRTARSSISRITPSAKKLMALRPVPLSWSR